MRLEARKCGESDAKQNQELRAIGQQGRLIDLARAKSAATLKLSFALADAVGCARLTVAGDQGDPETLVERANDLLSCIETTMEILEQVNSLVQSL